MIAKFSSMSVLRGVRLSKDFFRDRTRVSVRASVCVYVCVCVCVWFTDVRRKWSKSNRRLSGKDNRLALHSILWIKLNLLFSVLFLATM